MITKSDNSFARRFSSALLVSVGVYLFACGGGGGGGKFAASEPAVLNALIASNQSLSIDSGGAAGLVTRTLQIQASDPQNLPLTYTIVARPSAGVATLSSTGLLTYSLAFPSSASSDSLQVKISNAVTSTVVSVNVQTDSVSNLDPLLAWQWYLNNKNQYFASNVPAVGSGFDLNMGTLWTSGVKGTNVNVTVVDSGLEIAHEDLSANVVRGDSYNFLNGSTDPTNKVTTGDHGTSIAGIIAAVANNGVGISGIAPKANLRAYNYLTSTQSYAAGAIALGGNRNYSAVLSDVFNFSAGTDSASLYPPDVAEDAISLNTTTLRSGMGALIVKSAGNGFLGMANSAGTQLPGTMNTYCTNSGVTCQNVNQDSDNTLYSTLVVTAVDADSKRSSYASAGSAIWLAGFGGEFGYDSAIIPGNVPNSYKPAMVTTDQSGCNAGYVRSTATGGIHKNLLNKGDGTGTANATCNYTGSFNGTSAAAPTVTGVIALMLQVNPNLTWRDVRHILASTARVVQSSQPAVINTTYFNGSTLVLEQGWVTNAANFHFHNHYGFGLVDASAAVAAARTYVAGSLGVFQSVSQTAAIGATTIGQSFAGLTKTFAMAGLTTVEQAEITFNVGDGYLPYCNQVELTSPSGTKSIVFNMDSAHTSASMGGIRLLSNAFYGEPAAGTWTLKVMNRCASPVQSLSTAVGQQLTVRGH